MIQKSVLVQPVSKFKTCPYFIGIGCRYPMSVNGHVINFPISQTILSRDKFFPRKILQKQFLHIKVIFLHQHSCNEKNTCCTKIHTFFCLQQEHLHTCGFHILIVFAKCQEGVQRCTRCTACIMKFKKNSSHKGQNTKCALNYCGIRAQKDSWQSVLGNRNYRKASSGFAFFPSCPFSSSHFSVHILH